MKLVNDNLAVKAQLVAPNDNGYLVLAAEIGTWVGPFTLPSHRRRRLVARIAAMCEKLTERADVDEAITFRGMFRPPGEGSDILARNDIRAARYDLVVLIQTTTVDAIAAVRDDTVYREMVAVLERAARRFYPVAARNAARIADVDHGPNHTFLFNYFYADDTDALLDVWEYTAGWFQKKTALRNSTLMQPLASEAVIYGIVNHASWPNLRTFLPALLFRPSFRSFVLANFRTSDIAAQPIIYRSRSALLHRGDG